MFSFDPESGTVVHVVHWYRLVASVDIITLGWDRSFFWYPLAYSSGLESLEAVPQRPVTAAPARCLAFGAFTYTHERRQRSRTRRTPHVVQVRGARST